jgi:uncharacterized protein YjbI with pentapeptide repeats
VGRDSAAGYFVTAYHVVSDGNNGVVNGVDVYLSGKPGPIPGHVASTFSTALGIALVTIPARELPASLFPAPTAAAGANLPVHLLAGDGSVRSGEVSPQEQGTGDTFTSSFSGSAVLVGYSGGPVLADDGAWIGMHTAAGPAGVEIRSVSIMREVRRWVPGLVTSAEVLDAANRRFADSDPSQRRKGLAELDSLGASIPLYRDRIMETLVAFLKKTAAIVPPGNPFAVATDSTVPVSPIPPPPPARPGFETQAVLDVIAQNTWVVHRDIDFGGRSVAPDYTIDLSGLDLHGANLDGAWLNFASLNSANLANTLLAGAHLEKTDLRHASFSGADLTNALLDDTNAEHANFDDATLKGVSLAPYASLANASFKDAVLDEAEVIGTDFSKANFRNASLRKVSFEETTLDGAVFTGAHLEGANFSTSVSGLEPEQLNSTFGDAQTRIPAFWTRPSNWK